MKQILGPGTNALVEPPDHGIGRSRGGLSTKVHHAVDGHGRPLSILISAGQAGDALACLPLLAGIRIARSGPGRPRTRPTALLADRAYSSKAIRAHLRSRGITAVIPEPSDQRAHRARRGSRGGRPVSYDRELYKQRNVVEASFALLEQWRGLATRYDRHALIYRGAVVLAAVLAWTRT